MLGFGCRNLGRGHIISYNPRFSPPARRCVSIIGRYLSDMPIIETPPQPKKRSHKSNEGKIQSQCFVWFNNTLPQYRGLLFHVPNENDRADSNPIQGAIRKSLGVWPGVADLILLVPRGIHGALLIEMKDEHGQQKPAQKLWQAAVEAQNYRYEICRSLEQFKQIINEYLCLAH